MAIIQSGNSSDLMRVDIAGAAKVFNAPSQANNYSSLGVSTGLITGIAAGAAIFSLRNISTKVLAIQKAGIGFVCTTAFTAAQRVEFALQVARAFTVSDSGGTAIAFSGSNLKRDVNHNVLNSVDCRVATTAALTAGTKSLDSNLAGIQSAHISGVGAGIAPSKENLFRAEIGDYPLLLRQNEGINIVNNFLMGAAGVGVAYINIDFAEFEAYS